MYVFGITQAIKIAISYFALIVFLPSRIFGDRFKNEAITKRFMIYVVFGNLYLSTLVFILAYLNLFNRLSLLISILLTSILLYTILNRQQLSRKSFKTKRITEEVIVGEYGFQLFVSKSVKKGMRYLKRIYREVFYENKEEWFVFLLILLFNLYQYGINSVEHMTYVAPDEEIHLYWIQSLMKGNIYPSGVYPHVFHTIVAALIKTFNFNAMWVIIYFGMTISGLIMTMLYIGLRKVFKSKYAALFGFMLYSTWDIFLQDATYRYQFTIPQEYAMIMLIPMAIFLLDYIKEKKRSDLIFFSFALALAVGIHFYTGIVAIILAASIVMTYLYKLIKEKTFSKLLMAGILSAVLAVAPLAIGLSLGYELEQSFTWGAEVIKGDIYSETSDGALKEDKKVEETPVLTLEQFKIGAIRDIEKYVVPYVKTMYFILFSIVFSLLYNILLKLSKKEDSENEYQIAFAINSLLLLLLILFKALDLPTLMEPKRMAIYFAYFSSIFLGMPFEIGSQLLSQTKLKKELPILSLGIIFSSFLLIVRLDTVRNLPPSYYFQTTGTTLTNLNIMEEYKNDTWTVISPVNNISMIMGNGYHYELSEFILEQEHWTAKKEIQIPTEHVFLYVEKMPIIKYGFEFERGDPAINNRPKITKEDALQNLSESTKENYHYIRERNILMAKAYYWAEEYTKYFPKEIEVYYEDSELIVYRIQQNVNALNNFSIDYKLNNR